MAVLAVVAVGANDIVDHLIPHVNAISGYPRAGLIAPERPSCRSLETARPMKIAYFGQSPTYTELTRSAGRVLDRVRSLRRNNSTRRRQSDDLDLVA